jgi:hypothetical protein
VIKTVTLTAATDATSHDDTGPKRTTTLPSSAKKPLKRGKTPTIMGQGYRVRRL